ncbi:MAG: hypothetical protein ABJF10_08855 [Chthoniobacter sp.]|uniref:hypothetical protein n=1 Tax=Chthoniobacter sp. TaxID=2510640 RepID=UPI0032A8D497
MKATTLALGILSAVLLVPTAAFAHDKHKDRDCDRQAQIYADRRANGYYDNRYCPPSRYSYEKCRPDYRSRYYVPDCDRRDYRSSGFYIQFR